MRIAKPIHPWDVTPQEAVEIQRQLARRVLQVPALKRARYVAGADLSIKRPAHYVSGIVIWDMKHQEIVEEQTSRGELIFPYIPGLLSFREVPAILETLAKVEHTPDVIMCDGQGYAHPRRFGLACHLGVLLDMPATGCAKSILCGTHGPLDETRGSHVPLTHENEQVGAVVRTRDGVKPVFVSVGHKMDIKTAVELVLACGIGYRLPEPTRRAHKLVYGEMQRSYGIDHG